MQNQLVQFNAEYAAAIDEDRLEDWPAFFTEQGCYRVTTKANHARGLPAGLIFADSRAMLADRVLSLRQANVYEAQAYRHVVGLPRVLANDGDVARVSTSFVVFRINRDGTTDTFATGQYLDEVVQESSQLRLRRRDVICDSSRIDTLLAIPL